MDDIVLQDKCPVIIVWSVRFHDTVNRFEMHAVDAVLQRHEHHRGIAVLHAKMRDVEPLGSQRLAHFVSVLVLSDDRHRRYRYAHSRQVDTPVDAIASRIEHADVLVHVRTAKASCTCFDIHSLLQQSKRGPPKASPYPNSDVI